MTRSPFMLLAAIFLYVPSVSNSQEQQDPKLALVQNLQTDKNGISAGLANQMLERLGRKHVPEIFFYLDHSSQFGGRVEELLKRIKKRR